MSFQKSATKNLVKDEAVKAFAIAYHTFATKNKGLYRLIMSIPSEVDGLAEESIAHWQRVFRAILHGFISEEDLGYFYYYR